MTGLREAAGRPLPHVRTRQGSDAARRTLAGAASLSIVLGVLAWLRLPAIARDTFWAEDGRTFIQAALDTGWSGLFVPYGGYLQLVPRTLANLAVAIVPVGGYALFMSASASLVAGICAAVVWFTSRQHVRSGWALLIAASTVLVPLAAREVLGNAANLHTILMWALFWILLYTPSRKRTAILLAVFAVVAALSEVQAVFLLPLLFWHHRNGMRRIVYTGLSIGVAAQLLCVLVAPRTQMAFGHVDLLSYPYGFAINAVMTLVLPLRAIGPVLAAVGPLVPSLLVVVIAGLLFFLLRGSTSMTRGIVGAALGLAVLSFVAGVHTNPEDYYNYAMQSPAQLRTVWLARYGVLPSMLIVGALCAAAGARARRRPGRAGLRRGVTTTTAVLVLASFVVYFVPDDTRRSEGPAWQPQMAQARETCERGHGTAVLDQTLGWKVLIPCRRLLPPGIR